MSYHLLKAFSIGWERVHEVILVKSLIFQWRNGLQRTWMINLSEHSYTEKNQSQTSWLLLKLLSFRLYLILTKLWKVGKYRCSIKDVCTENIQKSCPCFFPFHGTLLHPAHWHCYDFGGGLPKDPLLENPLVERDLEYFPDIY